MKPFVYKDAIGYEVILVDVGCPGSEVQILCRTATLQAAQELCLDRILGDTERAKETAYLVGCLDTAIEGAAAPTGDVCQDEDA